MKTRLLASAIVVMSFFAALTNPIRLAAQGQQADKKEHRRYRVIDLGTLGGTFSQAFGINNNASVVGFATLTGDTAARLSVAQGCDDRPWHTCTDRHTAS